jgi:hypothetical protein
LNWSYVGNRKLIVAAEAAQHESLSGAKKGANVVGGDAVNNVGDAALGTPVGANEQQANQNDHSRDNGFHGDIFLSF